MVLSGGEPLLYPGLAAFIHRIKEETGLKVKVDTNGLNPDALKSLGADYIAMDFKAPPGQYHKLGGGRNSAERILRSLEYLKASDTPCEIRTTVVPAIISLEDAGEMAAFIKTESIILLQLSVRDIV